MAKELTLQDSIDKANSRSDTDYRVHIASECPICIHKTLGAPTCAAFPAGIPKEIIRGRVSHRTPYPGDGGTVFELDENSATYKMMQRQSGNE